MSITGNKGEWSEIYTFLKLLGDGVVYAGNEDLKKIQDLFYPIIMILRHEADGSYNYRLNEKNIIILKQNGEELLRVPASTFLSKAEELLETINNSKGTFSVPLIESFMKDIYCQSLKAKSINKADIHIILHDRRTRINSEMGFSIKSQLGGDSTLLNAGKTTNFNYKIIGADFSDEEIETINALNSPKSKVLDRVNAIKNKGARLIFDKVDNLTFSNNLKMLDGDLAFIISQLLLEQINTRCSKLKDLVEVLNNINPLGCNLDQGIPFYEYKIKHLLTSIALGMKPATAWNGKMDANGGYLVVKNDGEILCYHFYDKNRFEEFLFKNAYLERASTTRHDYASIVKEDDGSLSFKLNFQVRLK